MASGRGVALPVLALLLAAAAWGSTVVVAKSAFAHISPVNLTVARLALAGLVLLVVFFPHLRMPRRVAVRGVTLGLIFAGGIFLQIIGLQFTAPSVSGFITASYVVFTAIISAVVLRQRQPTATWVAVGLTVIGIGVLASGHSGAGAGLGLGAAITLLGAGAFAVHIVLLGRWVRPDNVKQLTLTQALTGLVLGLVVAPFSGFEATSEPTVWLQVLYLGIFCGAVTLFLQSWAQSYVPATPSAIIMCSEPVWSAVLAISFGLEPLTFTMVTGGALVVGALLLTSLPRKRRPLAEELVEDLRRRKAPERTRRNP
ncbi:DMT family transporter [Tessaracoccus sp. OS52]|uniref:DMT family transporter n=1 Tax=Tessaracoccus sp. OS52 TaxID=2886691 RepID=UPI001D0FEA2A|nr:DMT family transporter [Tessaracoccus sp. OS52]MCC2593411.1 DMT family transporter [Tessaracoccus sp. OS52]